MPEIPEMEVYKEFLNKYVRGSTITSTLVHRDKSINLEKNEFESRLKGEIIISIERVGKQLVFKLSNNQYLILHLMLDGRIYYLPYENALALRNPETSNVQSLKIEIPQLPGKPSVSLHLQDSGILFFCSLTLGYLRLISTEELLKTKLQIGQNPLAPGFNESDFANLLKGKKGMIKTWLMDQKYLSGIGNAYSNETLFEAGLLPFRPINSLTHNEKTILYIKLKKTLNSAIEHGGDIEDPFMPYDNWSGGYSKYFKVYEREGEPCKICNKLIERKSIGGRNAFFCINCQK